MAGSYQPLIPESDWGKTLPITPHETDTGKALPEDLPAPLAKFFSMAKQASSSSDEFQTEWQRQTAPCIDDQTATSYRLAAALVSLAVIHTLHQSEWSFRAAEEMYGRLLEMDGEDWHGITRRRAAHASLHFGWRCIKPVPDESPTISRYEAKLTHLFRKIDARPDPSSAHIRYLDHRVNISFSGKADPLYFEIDNERRFIYEPGKKYKYPLHYTGFAWLQLDIMKKLAPGAVIIHLLPGILNEVFEQKPKERKEFARTLMEAGDTVPPDIYDTRPDKNGNFIIAPARFSFP